LTCCHDNAIKPRIYFYYLVTKKSISYFILFSRLDIPPGSKILLKGTVAVEHGFLLLTNKNCQLIGGRVLKMAESWELKKVLLKN